MDGSVNYLSALCLVVTMVSVLVRLNEDFSTTLGKFYISLVSLSTIVVVTIPVAVNDASLFWYLAGLIPFGVVAIAAYESQISAFFKVIKK